MLSSAQVPYIVSSYLSVSLVTNLCWSLAMIDANYFKPDLQSYFSFFSWWFNWPILSNRFPKHCLQLFIKYYLILDCVCFWNIIWSIGMKILQSMKKIFYGEVKISKLIELILIVWKHVLLILNNVWDLFCYWKNII